MLLRTKAVILAVALGAICTTATPAGKKQQSQDEPAVESTGHAVLWQDPGNISARNLYYGIGGEEHQPRGPFTFVKEDEAGTSPKFDVLDRDGVSWKVKLGPEARSETAATRLVWAVGYRVDQDYLVPELQVDDLPTRLKRGSKLLEADGMIHNARLERKDKSEKKVGEWAWAHNRFYGTREFNGLRVLMAFVNNWDVKDQNNAVYEEKGDPEHHRYFVVADLGATFGSPGIKVPLESARDNLPEFAKSPFIESIHDDHVDFQAPSRPAVKIMVNPLQYVRRVHLEWVGQDIPRADARWMGGLLSKLSREQLQDAFRSANYSPQEMEGFVRVLEARIAQLNEL